MLDRVIVELELTIERFGMFGHQEEVSQNNERDGPIDTIVSESFQPYICGQSHGEEKRRFRSRNWGPIFYYVALAATT